MATTGELGRRASTNNLNNFSRGKVKFSMPPSEQTLSAFLPWFCKEGKTADPCQANTGPPPVVCGESYIAAEKTSRKECLGCYDDVECILSFSPSNGVEGIEM